MKHLILSIIYLLFIKVSIAQNTKFEYRGKYYPNIKIENLKSAVTLFDIMPEFSKHFSSSGNEHYVVHNLLKQQLIVDYPNDKGISLIEFLTIEIETTCNGKKITSKGNGTILNDVQKSNIAKADLFSNINITATYNYKNAASYLNSKNPKTGYYSAIVSPKTEALFPGGNASLTNYIITNIFNKAEKKNNLKIQNALVEFVVNEQGLVEKIQLKETTKDKSLDKLIIEAIGKMPTWKAAELINGKKVKQVISIPFWSGC
jgi:hypothetical protein